MTEHRKWTQECNSPAIMSPLFVSYFANWKGEHRGWLVFDDVAPIKDGKDADNLVRRIELHRGWPDNTVTIVSFQRLECNPPVLRRAAALLDILAEPWRAAQAPYVVEHEAKIVAEKLRGVHQMVTSQEGK